ncbi:basic proline-rich protein-like [Leopardus geoffroyi]|uniref:basic proline-rich protein-like n=1 Tax=Leopardus geoffroyi TaxID=46844 RepID=UPI001E260201|nr:basic proline-rich protein-like [Leopardus geoffroyi]
MKSGDVEERSEEPGEVREKPPAQRPLQSPLLLPSPSLHPSPPDLRGSPLLTLGDQPGSSSPDPPAPGKVVAGAGGQGLFHPPLSAFSGHNPDLHAPHRPTDRPSDRACQLPGSRRTALNARLEPETRGDKGLSGRGPRSPAGTHRHARGRTDRRTTPAVGVGPAYRGAEVPTKVQEAVSGLYIPRRGRAGGVPGGERGVPAPPPRELGGPAPPPSPAAGGRVRRSPGLRASGPSRAAPRGPPNFQRCPAPRPRRRLGVSIVGPGPGSERGGPGAHGARPPALAPPAPAAAACPPPPPLLFSRRHSAPSPALRSAPCPAALSPPPPSSSAGRPGIRRHLPRLPPPPPARLPGSLSLGGSPPSRCRSLRVSLRGPFVSVALPVSPLPASASALSLSPARLYLSSSRSPSVRRRLSPPPTLGAAPAVSDPGPRLRRVPGSPGSPSSRRPRRAENSQLAARRPALRDFRPSSHVTRAPVRRPRAPPPQGPGPRRPAGPRPGPLPAARRVFQPPSVGRPRGAGPGAGGCVAPLLPPILPGFSSSLPERSSQNPFRESAPGFPGPQGQEYPHLKTLRTVLGETEVAWLEGPSRPPRQRRLILQTGRLSAREGPELAQGHGEVAEPDPNPVSGSLRPHYSELSLQGRIPAPASPQVWAPHSGLRGVHPRPLTAPGHPDPLRRGSAPPPVVGGENTYS